MANANPLVRQFTNGEKWYIICRPRVRPYTEKCYLRLENAAVTYISFPSKLGIVDNILSD